MPSQNELLSVVQKNFARLFEDPLLAIPEECRPATFRVWSMFRHLKDMDTPWPIAAPLGIWMEQGKIEPDQAVVVLDRLLEPEMVAKIRYTSDLIAELANNVLEANKELRLRNEKRRMANYKKEKPTSRALVNKLLESIAPVERELR